MRQIKFRALAVVNDKHAGIKVGDFVFGSFIQSGCDAPCIIFGDGEQIEIDIKTLGQLIGLKDKDGVDIYEGDILSKHYKSGNVDEICQVKFEHGFFCGWFDYEPESWFSICQDNDRQEIIGNIHQNPELLENK